MFINTSQFFGFPPHLTTDSRKKAPVAVNRTGEGSVYHKPDLYDHTQVNSNDELRFPFCFLTEVQKNDIYERTYY